MSARHDIERYNIHGYIYYLNTIFIYNTFVNTVHNYYAWTYVYNGGSYNQDFIRFVNDKILIINELQLMSSNLLLQKFNTFFPRLYYIHIAHKLLFILMNLLSL